MDDFITHIAAELVKHAWVVIVFIAVPVGAVVGFLVQLRTLKKLRLDIEKLRNELQNAQKVSRELDLKIQKLTGEEQRQKIEDSGLVRSDVIQMRDLVARLKVSQTAVLEETAPSNTNLEAISDGLTALLLYILATGAFVRLVLWAFDLLH
ncbi:hypothetical protein AWB79_07536 [Caballeronia hypogeia]|uniref:Uncharacterized protein n=1 Tax=Caballeronia hypogeia TaxID=1777140 RepID=A0A158DW11_9BURK|nr:hypothetical protein [Caballeronia hypogeia]SAK97907.1 hypothetical protein AWB79_07536 [Caballeronia hypogeia]